MSGPPPVRVAGWPPLATRHATWLEMFFDLVFVVAVSNLGRVLLADHSPGGALVFLGLFVPVWWVWIGTGSFVDQFELPELWPRLMFSQLVFAPGLFVAAHPALSVVQRAAPRGPSWQPGSPCWARGEAA